jgi:23S rRNA pseudouridine955/2504/2580 synthase
MAQLKGVPKSHVYRIVRSGEVRINKGRCKPSQRICEGDEVRIPPVRVSKAEAPGPVGQGLAERLSRSLLHEDDSLLIYNKPAGLAVHGGSGVSLGLIEALRSLHPQEKSLELVHRLDRDTSGCIMVARKRPFLRRLQRLLQEGGIDKRYWLLCTGFQGVERSVDAPLLKVMQGSERVVRVSREGKSSLTHFRLHERLAHGEWLEAELASGRTHQIRVHAQYGGFPLYGDPKYGDDRANRWLAGQGVKRLCLHARQLVFRHPDTGHTLDIRAPLDEDFEQAIACLRG